MQVSTILQHGKNGKYKKPGKPLEQDLHKETAAYEISLIVLVFFALGFGLFAIKPMLPGLMTSDWPTGYVVLTESNSNSSNNTVAQAASASSSGLDVRLEMLPEQTSLPFRENLRVQVTIFNIIGKEIDTIVTYFIQDTDSSMLFERSEIVTVRKQVSYPVAFETKYLQQGNYILGVQARAEGSFAVSTQQITITPKSFLMLAQERTIFRQQAVVLFMFAVLSALITYFALRLRALYAVQRRN